MSRKFALVWIQEIVLTVRNSMVDVLTASGNQLTI